METPKKRKVVDWDAVERDYRTGKFTLSELGAKYGVSHVAVSKQARRRGWTVEKDRQFFEPTSRADDFSKPGHVYVVYFDDSACVRWTKLGMATHLESRIKSHQGSCPFEMKIALSYFVGNMRREESRLHTMFARKRVRGEWFALDQADLEEIAKGSLLQ